MGDRKMSIRIAANVLRYGRARLHTVMSLTLNLAVALTLTLACAPSAGPAAQQPAPAGSGPRDYRKIESEVLAALNVARTQPKTAASWLEKLVPHFNGNLLKRPDWPMALRTTEGVRAVREAIGVLNRQSPVSALTLNAALTRAARDHAADQARTAGFGHAGSDGSTVTSRVARYGTWQISINENIDYQPMRSGQNVIESLLIDDGVPDRGHRHNIFEPKSRVVGIACGPHPRYEATCVIVQAGGMSAR